MDNNIINGEDFDVEQPKLDRNKKKRILLKNEKKISEVVNSGLVVTSKGRFYFVKKTNDDSNFLYKCVVSGSIQINHNHKTILTVGDKCEFIAPNDNTDGQGLGRITKVEERETFLLRKSINGNNEDVIAANMHQVLVILAAENPKYNLHMLDKILISCEYGSLKPLICINKMDLVESEKVFEDFKEYIRLGYQVFYISALKLENLKQVYKAIENKVTLFIGVSGVGKSTLVNSLFGKEIQKVGKLAKNLRGRHTTTSCNYLFLDNNTAIIDSPGFREFDLFGITKEELPFYFPDFEPFYRKCKFQPCSHTHEPDCAVKKALQKGKISKRRYFSYLTIYENL
ncbi:MAG: ribosome small subunit-dependent GTPase A [Ignavibacteria bacterium]|nr:ribosome small subunit-dependent GTPase A [Ignavibacteria bacterium]